MAVTCIPPVSQVLSRSRGIRRSVVIAPAVRSGSGSLYRHLTGVAESTVFIGYVGLALSVLAIIKLKTREVTFLGLGIGCILALSLGPALTINGVVVRFPSAIPYIHNAAVPLPYYILMRLPVFSIARVPSRWDIMVVLCVSVSCPGTHFSTS